MTAHLPPIRCDEFTVRLPLCEPTAAALLSVLLAPTDAAAHSELREALALDPALALWSVYHHAQDDAGHGSTPSIDTLSAWLAARLPSLLDVSGNDERSSPAEWTVSPAALPALAADAVAAAVALVGDKQSLTDGKYLAVLVERAVSQWLPALGCSIESIAALRRRLDLAVFAERPRSAASSPQRRNRKAPVKMGAQRAVAKKYPAGSLAELARQRWLAPAGFATKHFDTLSARLTRLIELEDGFGARLEEEKLASLAEFAAGAGHEINNPLAVISGRAQLFLRTEEDPERRRELAIINTQARRVHEMIADLMLFARPPEPRLAPCDLGAIVDELVTELSPRAAEHGVELLTHSAQALPAIDADATQLLVALRAVSENALNALDSGGRIEIDVRVGGPWKSTPLAAVGPRIPPRPSGVRAGVRGSELAGPSPSPQPSPIKGEGGMREPVAITIRDNGPGMPPEVRRHAFDPFFSGRGAGRGLGNGLSKCWRIITGHGGSVEIDSTPAGTSVTMLLPLSCEPTSATAPPARRAGAE